MEKKSKKKPKAVQIKRKYRAIQWSCFAGEFLSVFAPYITIGAIKFDEYFVQTGADSWKVSLGGILAMCVMGLATWLVARKKENKEVTNGFIALVVGWFTVAFIFYLLSDIINDIAMIMFCGGIGLLGALGLDITSNTYKRKADKYKAYIEDAKMRNSNIDAEIEHDLEKKRRLEEERLKGMM